MIRVCAAEQLAEGQARGFHLNGNSLVVVRKYGQVHAWLNLCPHRQVPLNWQPDAFLDDSASLLRCAHHGALFLIDSGECVSGPCTGESLVPIDCREVDQAIWLLNSPAL